MKRCSKKQSFGFVISPLAKLTTGAALVDTVYSNSLAEKSGLLPGDRITTINGKRVDKKTDVDGLIDNVLDLKLTVARVQRVSIDEMKCGQQSTSDVDQLMPKDNVKNASDDESDSDKECKNDNKESKSDNKFPETDEEFRHRYSWGTGTIIDRYPEARAMLRMLGRGPYSDDLRDYSCHY
jgi:membrane-associated protease RseP (regulator of RpoE activity)